MIKADVFDHLLFEASPLDPCFFMKRETTPRSSAIEIDSEMDAPVFTTEPDDPSLVYTGRFVVVALYVDDLWVVGNWKQEVERLKGRLTECFQCDKFEPPSWFLGWNIEVDEEAQTVKLSQGRLIREATDRFSLTDRKPRKTPVAPDHVFESPDETCLLSKARQVEFMEKLGVLNYLSTQVCAVVAYGVSKLGAFMQQADEHHMDAVDRILVWLGGHADEGIWYCKSKLGSLVSLLAYSDASYADKGQTGSGRRRSQSGIVILLCGCLIHWKSVGQKTVALSTAEAELIALSATAQEVIYFRRTLHFLGWEQQHATPVMEDNTAAEAICSSEIATKRSRFIDVRYHYCRQMQQESEIDVRRCDTRDMRADMFTKALPLVTLVKHWRSLCGGKVDVIAAISGAVGRLWTNGELDLPALFAVYEEPKSAHLLPDHGFD